MINHTYRGYHIVCHKVASLKLLLAGTIIQSMIWRPVKMPGKDLGIILIGWIDTNNGFR